MEKIISLLSSHNYRRLVRIEWTTFIPSSNREQMDTVYAVQKVPSYSLRPELRLFVGLVPQDEVSQNHQCDLQDRHGCSLLSINMYQIQFFLNKKKYLL
jgi:hypothetical protein